MVALLLQVILVPAFFISSTIAEENSALCETTMAEHVAMGNGSILRLENVMKGRVEVCWEGEWREVYEGAIRTTQQANYICKRLNYLPEGAEILESVELNNNSCSTLSCFCWLDVDSEEFNVTCSQDQHNHCNNPNITTDNRTAVIMCKESSLFTPELIALTVLLPLLLGVILVGTIVLIHSFRKAQRLNTIIHRLIYKQQKLKADLVQGTSLEESGIRTSMYAKPLPAKPLPTNGSTKRARDGDGNTVHGSALPGPSQYSLLGNDKYENIDLNEIQKAP